MLVPATEVAVALASKAFASASWGAALTQVSKYRATRKYWRNVEFAIDYNTLSPTEMQEKYVH